MRAKWERSLAGRTWLDIFIAASAGAFVGVPIWELIVPGPFDWHLGIAPFWQGGLEALALAALVGIGFASNRNGWLLALVALPALLYLRRYAVDGALLLDALYLELIIGLGMSLRRWLRLPTPTGSLDYLQAFVAGLVLWSACAWTASALNHGSPKELQWLTLLLAIPAMFGGHRPLSLHLWRRVRAQKWADRIWCGVLVAWVLVLFARSRVAVGYDSLWYGLRSQYVLVPAHSVYEPLALTSPVHYYPKLYEMFLLPLGILDDYATIDAMSILLLLLLLLVCRLLMRQLRLPERAQLPTLALIATLPVLANIATYAGPDMFSTLFGTLAMFFALQLVRRRSAPAGAWMLACAALACCGKLTAIPYMGVLLLLTCAIVWARRTSPAEAPMPLPERRHAWTVLGLALLASAFVVSRTVLLAGLPTVGPDPLVKLWLALGFQWRAPAGTLQWGHPQDWADVPYLLMDWLFRPQTMPHIIITWVGNVWLWLALVAAAAAAGGRGRDTAQERGQSWPLLALMATALMLALGNRFMVRGGDGNYFALGLLPAILVSSCAAFSRLRAAARSFALVLVCICAFVFFQASYSFISGAWVAGTRAFDLDFSRSPRDTRRQRRVMVDYYGIARISEFLKTLPHGARVTGSVESRVQFWLPARFEDFATVFYSHPEYIKDPASVRRFLAAQKISYVIMPNPDTQDLRNLELFGAEAAKQVADLLGARLIRDRRYYLIDLTGVDPLLLNVSDRSTPDRSGSSAVDAH